MDDPRGGFIKRAKTQDDDQIGVESDDPFDQPGGGDRALGNYDDDALLLSLPPEEYPYRAFLLKVREYEALLARSYYHNAPLDPVRAAAVRRWKRAALAEAKRPKLLASPREIARDRQLAIDLEDRHWSEADDANMTHTFESYLATFADLTHTSIARHLRSPGLRPDKTNEILAARLHLISQASSIAKSRRIMHYVDQLALQRARDASDSGGHHDIHPVRAIIVQIYHMSSAIRQLNKRLFVMMRRALDRVFAEPREFWNLPTDPQAVRDLLRSDPTKAADLHDRDAAMADLSSAYYRTRFESQTLLASGNANWAMIQLYQSLYRHYPDMAGLVARGGDQQRLRHPPPLFASRILYAGPLAARWLNADPSANMFLTAIANAVITDMWAGSIRYRSDLATQDDTEDHDHTDVVAYRTFTRAAHRLRAVYIRGRLGGLPVDMAEMIKAATIKMTQFGRSVHNGNYVRNVVLSVIIEALLKIRAARVAAEAEAEAMREE